MAGDFDGDGHADIYAVQNSHAPSPVYGWFNGGLGTFLRGDGTGHFTALMPAESGVVVPGDAKSLAVLDTDGDGRPDLLATRNNSTPVLLQNRAPLPGRMLAVRLRGAAGNPAGIGARVTVEAAGQPAQVAEIYAGGGFASQSTATCFFGIVQATAPVKIRVNWPSGKSASRAWRRVRGRSRSRTGSLIQAVDP